MHDDRSEQRPKRSSHGLLLPGHFLWARALPWSVVLGIALWITYKFVKGVGIDLGLGGTGVPTELGVLAALTLYVLSVRVIEQQAPNELAPTQGVEAHYATPAF
jgi:hypothetical protein